jgi:nicotinamidase-related amidase
MKVLVVVDVQNDFVTGALGNPDAQAAIPAIKEKIATYLANDDIIIYTRDTHQEDYMETSEGKYLPVPHCIEGTEGWEIVDGIYADDCVIIDKPTFGVETFPAFLDEFVADDDIEEIEFVGFCTDICVISNALIVKAWAAPYQPFITVSCDSACCAGVTKEKHEAALEVMRSCQIEVR